MQAGVDAGEAIVLSAVQDSCMPRASRLFRTMHSPVCRLDPHWAGFHAAKWTMRRRSAKVAKCRPCKDGSGSGVRARGPRPHLTNVKLLLVETNFCAQAWRRQSTRMRARKTRRGLGWGSTRLCVRGLPPADCCRHGGSLLRRGPYIECTVLVLPYFTRGAARGLTCPPRRL